MSHFSFGLMLALALAAAQNLPAQVSRLRVHTRYKFQQPETLSFDELVTLASTDPPPPVLARKLDVLLSTPFINNDAATRNVAPKSPRVAGIGPVLRLAEWNINRGENENQVAMALADAPAFLASARQNPKLYPKERVQLSGELSELQSADVIILDEVDRGVKRTAYHDVAGDLARKLDMNYAYAVEFIELDRIYLGVKNMDSPDAARSSNGQTFGLDPRRYLGLEGSAILSRYPIRSARIIRLPELYDWYHDEIKAISALEQARRWSAEQLFEERISRQVRRGNRMALIVDLELPQSPAGVITLVCPHLEDYVGPGGRSACPFCFESFQATVYRREVISIR